MAVATGRGDGIHGMKSSVRLPIEWVRQRTNRPGAAVRRTGRTAVGAAPIPDSVSLMQKQAHEFEHDRRHWLHALNDAEPTVELLDGFAVQAGRLGRPALVAAVPWTVCTSVAPAKAPWSELLYLVNLCSCVTCAPSIGRAIGKGESQVTTAHDRLSCPSSSHRLLPDSLAPFPPSSQITTSYPA